MAVHFEVRIYSAVGAERSRIALTDNFGKLGVKLSLDAMGMLTWWMPATHPAFADLEKRGLVELWRFDDNPDHSITNHILFGGLYLGYHWSKRYQAGPGKSPGLQVVVKHSPDRLL